MRATAAVAIDGTRRRSFGRACHLGPPISRAQRVPERKRVLSPLLVKPDTLGRRSLVPISHARRVFGRKRDGSELSFEFLESEVSIPIGFVVAETPSSDLVEEGTRISR